MESHAIPWRGSGKPMAERACRYASTNSGWISFANAISNPATSKPRSRNPAPEKKEKTECPGAPRDEVVLVMSERRYSSLHTRQRAASRSTMHRPEFGRRSVANCMRRGLAVCCSRGPTARNHTSLGQRPRYRDCVDSGGLKARPIGKEMARPYRASAIGASVTWAVGPGWYGARRWRWGTRGFGRGGRGRRGLAFCRESVRYREALAPLQGALMGGGR